MLTNIQFTFEVEFPVENIQSQSEITPEKFMSTTTKRIGEFFQCFLGDGGADVRCLATSSTAGEERGDDILALTLAEARS